MFTELMATTLKPEEREEEVEEGVVRNINLLRGGGQEIIGCKGSQTESAGSPDKGKLERR
jgi:hypothetical protein